MDSSRVTNWTRHYYSDSYRMYLILDLCSVLLRHGGLPHVLPLAVHLDFGLSK